MEQKQKVRLTKIDFVTDSNYTVLNADFDVFEQHPNGINVGTVREGYTSRQPTVGKCFCITNGMQCFQTSPVQEVYDSGFKTLNSYYTLSQLH